MYPGLPNYGYGVQIGLPEALTILGIGPWAQDRKLDRRLKQEEADRASRAQTTSDMDSASKAEYYKQAGVAQQIDALKGILGTLFRPEDDATREQVLAKMYELAGIAPASGNDKANEDLSGLGAVIDTAVADTKAKKAKKNEDVKDVVSTFGAVPAMLRDIFDFRSAGANAGNALTQAISPLFQPTMTGTVNAAADSATEAVKGGASTAIEALGAALQEVLSPKTIYNDPRSKLYRGRPKMDKLSDTGLGTINYRPR